ncbi:cytochrome P450 71A1-like [Phalaenopsis equestris]|uniref:cytochrome P450 71A1-like n=1 Tax=Phalaenopsis equestris TaxID=78828 RepID=UPI0009E35BCF|nr:cytochrome P450 71A1-like [Phalaenopsis equestris]
MDSMLLAALVLIPLLSLLVERSKGKSISKKTPLLPSPRKLPFIGNLHQMGLLPHRSLFKLSKKHGPLMLLQLGSVPTLIVSSPSVAQKIVRKHDLIFASRPSLKASRMLFYNNNDIAFAPYGEYWRQMKKVCVTNLLSLKMIKSFSLVRMEEVSLMMERISRIASTNKGVVCMSEILNSFTCNVIFKSLFGSSLSQEKREHLCEFIRESTVLFGEVFLEDYFPGLRWLDVLMGLEGKLRRQFEKWDILLGDFIQDHIVRFNDGEITSNTNLINVMLQLQKNSSMEFVLTNEHIKAILLDMIAGGTDTSFATLDWSMAELIRNPDVMKKVQNEVRETAHGKEIVEEKDLDKLDYMRAVIKEVLRLHPPVPLLLPRESLQDCQIQKYHISKGTKVLINAWAIGRDDVYWKEAQEFKPERFLGSAVDYKGNDFHYIPFGSGRRICPGMQFAVAIVELALANLLHRFNWELPSGNSCDGMDMLEGEGITSVRKEKLELVPIAIKHT